MSVIAKENRTYPYNNGLLLGTEFDIILANENSEPIDSLSLFKENDKFFSSANGGGEGGNGDEEENNCFKPMNGMIRLFTRMSYCRGYSVDNIWWIMKELVIQLKKRAFISSVPYFLAEDFIKSKDDGMSYVAAGHIKVNTTRSIDIYSSGSSVPEKLVRMTKNEKDESHLRLKDNIRLVIGILSLLLDRRECAEFRRIQYGPTSNLEFRVTDKNLVYQTPTNYWLFSPPLSHLILGCMRMAYFITLNKIEPEIWEGFEPGDVITAIKTSNYEMGEEIWNMVKSRLGESGYRNAENPFWQHMKMVLDFVLDKGINVIGGGIYKNWQMSRKTKNYAGHFGSLPSWENGMTTKVLIEKHPNFKEYAKYRDNYERREKERAAT